MVVQSFGGIEVGNSRGRARIGVVVPFSNVNLEPDMMLLRPDGVSLHFPRAGGYDLDAVPDSDQMRRFALASLDEVVAALAAARPDVILYGCTSATLAHGPDFDRRFQRDIERKAGVPAVTAAGALVEALTALGVSRIAYASPYVAQLNREAIDFFANCGFDTVSLAEVGEDLSNYGQGELTPDEVYKLAVEADRPEAEALVLSCTDMRALEAVAALERDLAKPVVTSNRALMVAAVARLGLGHESLPAAARLFAA